MKLEGRFSVDQVIYAITKYTDQKNDIPAPADIILILNPPKPRITEAAFVEAQKWQEKNQRWDEFTDAGEIVKLYRKQEADERGHYNTQNKQLLRLAAGSLKRMEIRHDD